MKLEKVNMAKTQEYVQTIYSRRSALSNYYGQPFEENDYYFETNNTFVLAKPVRDFHRIYVASNDKKELVEILSSLEGTNVINFPTKGDISDIEAIMTESGYEQIGIYNCFLLNTKDMKISVEDMTTISIATEADEEEVYNLYSNWKGFNPYTDWLPTHKELKEYIANKTVLINRQDNKIVGTNIFSRNKWRLIIDLSGNAIKLVNAMFEMIREDGVKCFRCWINSQNERSIKFYARLGVIPDELKDYTYIKR